MPIYQYTFSHKTGEGQGSIEAKTAKEATQEIKDLLKSSETDDYKIEELKVEVKLEK